jgi:DNA-binding CsgD family transcriptional regulator/PAS domain-containing protein
LALLENPADEASLIAQIYESATEPALWSPFIRTVARTAEARTGVIYQSDLRAGTARMLCAHELDRSLQPEYERYYNTIDVFQSRALRLSTSDVSSTHKLILDSELERTEFYCDFLRPLGIFYATGGVVAHEDGMAAIFGVQRDRGDGPFDDSTEQWLNDLAPHIRRALHIGRRLEVLDRAAGSVLDAFAAWTDAVLLVDGTGRILFLNPAAERLLAAIPLAPRGRVADSPLPAARLLLDMIAAAAACADGKRGGEGSGGCVLPVNGRMVAATALPFRAPAPVPGTTRAVALVSFRVHAADGALQALARRYGLTAAEARLWRELLAGKALKAIAGKRGTSVETLRIHLKNLFRKTGVHRQSELMRLGLMNDGAGE